MIDEDTIAATAGAPAHASGVLERGVMIGRYTLLSRIGAGGMGVVYAAFDPELDRKVALKLLHADGPDAARSDGRRRLQREAQALAKLDHPNVVTVHDVLEYDGRVVLAMEFVDGMTLTRWLRAVPRSWREIVDVFVAAGRGLIAAHDRGLVHRDFKPDNVMITTSGTRAELRVRVMDFGLARNGVDTGEASRDDARSASVHDDQATRAGSIVGTPAYMAPEQFAGSDVGPAADQFAFCVALWEALYGARPFRGTGVYELARAVAGGERSAPPPGVRVPRWLHRACERGLATAPAQRFPTMHALVATLESGHRRRQIRTAAIGFGAIAVLGLGVTLVRQRAHAEAVAACEQGGAEIEEVWNDSARARVRAGLLASGGPSAETAADKVMPWLDAHAQAWQRARVEACAARSIHARWDDDMLDRATWCLDERKRELQALVTRLADADAEATSRAVVAAATLLRIEPCLDDATLRRNSPPPPAARDEVADIDVELARARALQATGAFDEGLEVARASLQRAERLGWPHLTSVARQLVGALLTEAGTYAEAETVMEAAYFEALAAGEMQDAWDAADDLANLVGTTRARPDEGMRWAKHAAALGAAVPDPLDMHEAFELVVVARIEAERGNYEEAQAGFERALARLEGAIGTEHPNIATVLTNLGLARFRRGDYAQATADFERALAIVETTKGREHRDVAISLNNLAIVAVRRGDYARAKLHLERALAVDTVAYGPSHPAIATVASNLGVVVYVLGDYDEAIALHDRAMAISKAVYGPEHPEVADSLNNLGIVHLALGDLERAQQLHQDALAIKTRALGVEHSEVARTLGGLATVLQRRGENDAAEPMFVRALAVLERALGPEHPDLAEVLVGLARVAIARGRGAEAVGFAERALALRERGDAPAEQLALARVVLARALIVSDAHSARAAELAEQGCTTLRDGGPGMRHYLADCDAFAKSSSSLGSERD